METFEPWLLCHVDHGAEAGDVFVKLHPFGTIFRRLYVPLTTAYLVYAVSLVLAFLLALLLAILTWRW